MTTRRLGSIVLLGVLAACSGSDAGSNTESDAESESTAPATTVIATTTAEPAAAETPATEPPATTQPPATSPPTTVPTPDPWTPVGPGPYEVGVTTITVDDPNGARPLTTDVWFPLGAQVDADLLAPQRYTLIPDVVFYDSPGAFAATAEQISDDGPYPLIVYSHGSSGLRYIHSSYTEALASHGYVVVAADHTGNTALDLLAGNSLEPGVIALARPTDVRRLVDAFVDATHPTAGPFAAMVDADSVVITGHSFGGFTSLAAVTGFANDLGEAPADDRVRAIVLLAPAVGSTSFPDDTLAALDTPMMIVVGTDDVTTPVDPNVTRPWDIAANSPAYRVELVAAEHQTFTDLCAYEEALETRPDIPELIVTTIEDFAAEGCSEGDMDNARAVELTNTYVLQFLDEVLRDGDPIDPALVATPDDVIFAAR